MAIRLIECHRVLKQKGSLYLHCDPTMSHYLKITLDCIFKSENFRNEIIWHYQTGGASKTAFARKHDVILFYSKSNDYIFNADDIHIPRSEKSLKRAKNPKGARISVDNNTKIANDVFTDIQALNPMAKERSGYPTQKPVKLLERIIKASSNENDILLDPFCGSGTSCIAAENLNRQWIAVDISQKAYEMVKERLESDNIWFSVDAPKRSDIS